MLNIITDDEMGSSICMDCDDPVKSFLDIYVDGEDIKSPFKTVDDTRVFAEMLVKLLEAVHDFK